MTPSFPVCFVSAAQYQNWSQVAATVPPKPELGFCEDCTSEHQARMGRQGKCARPDVQFVKGVPKTETPPPKVELTPEEQRRRQYDREYSARLRAHDIEAHRAKRRAAAAAERERKQETAR